MDINGLDDISKALTDGLKAVKKHSKGFAEKNEIDKLMRDGIEAMTKNDSEGIEDFKKARDKFSDKMNKKYS